MHDKKYCVRAMLTRIGAHAVIAMILYFSATDATADEAIADLAESMGDVAIKG